jgi:hypothetical protein
MEQCDMTPENWNNKTVARQLQGKCSFVTTNICILYIIGGERKVGG